MHLHWRRVGYQEDRTKKHEEQDENAVDRREWRMAGSLLQINTPAFSSFKTTSQGIGSKRQAMRLVPCVG